jgi:hypothetical protein
VRPALLEHAKGGGRAGPVRAEPGRAAVRAAWGLEAVGQAVADQEVVGQEGHPRPSGLSSMPWSSTPMAMASWTVVS